MKPQQQDHAREANVFAPAVAVEMDPQYVDLQAPATLLGGYELTVEVDGGSCVVLVVSSLCFIAIHQLIVLLPANLVVYGVQSPALQLPLFNCLALIGRNRLIKSDAFFRFDLFSY